MIFRSVSTVVVPIQRLKFGAFLWGNGSYNWVFWTRRFQRVFWCLGCPYHSWWRFVKASLAWHTICAESSLIITCTFWVGFQRTGAKTGAFTAPRAWFHFKLMAGLDLHYDFIIVIARGGELVQGRRELRKMRRTPCFFLIYQFHHRNICMGSHIFFTFK